MSVFHPRTASARQRPERGVVPEPPDASFWLERTPLPTPRRADPAKPGRQAFAPPSTACPKCDSPLAPSEAACPSCGLRRIMFNRFRASSADRVPEALEKLWRQVEAQWSDASLHERFLAQVSLCGAYAYAAARYRRAAKQRQSDAISNLQLERLSRMVHAVMAVSAVKREADKHGRPYRRVLVFLVLLVGLGALGSLYMIHRRNKSGQESIERVPSSITVRRGRSIGPDGKAAPAFGGMRALKGRADAGDENDQGDLGDEGQGPRDEQDNQDDRYDRREPGGDRGDEGSVEEE
jgi:hypothetical protein